jgi:hypothetical protein
MATAEGEIDALQKIWNWAIDIITTEEVKINCYFPETITEVQPCTW